MFRLVLALVFLTAPGLVFASLRWLSAISGALLAFLFPLTFGLVLLLLGLGLAAYQLSKGKNDHDL
jgi:hypothetical protein